jgi:hypothetical protein
VVSHRFARKKAKGWGTVLVQNQTAKDLVQPSTRNFAFEDCGALKLFFSVFRIRTDAFWFSAVP